MPGLIPGREGKKGGGGKGEGGGRVELARGRGDIICKPIHLWQKPLYAPCLNDFPLARRGNFRAATKLPALSPVPTTSDTFSQIARKQLTNDTKSRKKTSLPGVRAV